MPVEKIAAHPRVRQNAGRVALQRGPVVYCLEEPDNGPDLNAIALPRNARVKVVPGPRALGRPPMLEAAGRRRRASEWRDVLYRPDAHETAPCTVRAIPYYLWANRGPAEMLVWIPGC